MHERYAVAFRTQGTQATGRLEINEDRLLLCGRTNDGLLELEIPFADLTQVRVGRTAGERVNGLRTLVLESCSMPAVRVAPLGMAILPEITDLFVSLSRASGGDLLVVRVPLKPGCLGRACELLEKGPPLDPSVLGLRSHEVYLYEGEAIFVFRGSSARARVGRAVRHPAVWRAGLAWQRCLAGTPQIVDAANVNLDAEPAYRWAAADAEATR